MRKQEDNKIELHSADERPHVLVWSFFYAHHFFLYFLKMMHYVNNTIVIGTSTNVANMFAVVCTPLFIDKFRIKYYNYTHHMAKYVRE